MIYLASKTISSGLFKILSYQCYNACLPALLLPFEPDESCFFFVKFCILGTNFIALSILTIKLKQPEINFFFAA